MALAFVNGQPFGYAPVQLWDVFVIIIIDISTRGKRMLQPALTNQQALPIFLAGMGQYYIDMVPHGVSLGKWQTISCMC
jgi:hypothetical protein